MMLKIKYLSKDIEYYVREVYIFDCVLWKV